MTCGNKNKSILMIENDLNDYFLSHHLNSMTSPLSHFSNQELKKIIQINFCTESNF